MKIHVESEFAPLRKVVLAASEFAFPTIPLTEKEKSFLLPEIVTMYEKGYGKNFKDVFPELQVQWESERRNLHNLLKRHGIEVLEPRLLTEEEKVQYRYQGYSNFFARDPFFTIGEYVIEGSLRFMHRRNEITPIRPILREHIISSNALYVSCPAPEHPSITIEDDSIGPFLEGGDIHVIKDHLFVGISGLATNENGFEWLKQLLPTYTIEKVRLHPSILHLDCAMSLVREGLMIVCEDAFLDGLPVYFDTWDKIHVTLEQCAQLITNGLPINPDLYITDQAFQDIGLQLEERGVTVEYLDFSITRSFGGSIRCSTQPLARTFEK